MITACQQKSNKKNGIHEQEMMLIPFEKENLFPSHQESSKMSDDEIPLIFYLLKMKINLKNNLGITQLYVEAS